MASGCVKGCKGDCYSSTCGQNCYSGSCTGNCSSNACSAMCVGSNCNDSCRFACSSTESTGSDRKFGSASYLANCANCSSYCGAASCSATCSLTCSGGCKYTSLNTT